MHLKDDGYREAMTGTLTLYDKSGERLHTTYIAATPEYGKEKFFPIRIKKMNGLLCVAMLSNTSKVLQEGYWMR